MSARHSVENKSIAKLPCTITTCRAQEHLAIPIRYQWGGTVGLTKSQSVATAKKRVQIASLPVSFARTLLAMFSRLLARWLRFRLSDQLIAAGYALVTAGRSGVSIMGRSWAVLMVVRCRTRVTGL